jgi:hypothetical protein
MTPGQFCSQSITEPHSPGNAWKAKKNPRDVRNITRRASLNVTDLGFRLSAFGFGPRRIPCGSLPAFGSRHWAPGFRFASSLAALRMTPRRDESTKNRRQNFRPSTDVSCDPQRQQSLPVNRRCRSMIQCASTYVTATGRHTRTRRLSTLPRGRVRRVRRYSCVRSGN